MPHAVKDKVESSYKHTRAQLARIHNASAVRSFIWSTCSVSHAKIKWGWFEFVVYVFLSAPKFWDLGLFGNVFFFPQHPQRLGVVFCCSLQFFSHVWWGLGVLFGLCPFFEKRHAPFVGRVCVCVYTLLTQALCLVSFVQTTDGLDLQGGQACHIQPGQRSWDVIGEA